MRLQDSGKALERGGVVRGFSIRPTGRRHGVKQHGRSTDNHPGRPDTMSVAAQPTDQDGLYARSI